RAHDGGAPHAGGGEELSVDAPALLRRTLDLLQTPCPALCPGGQDRPKGNARKNTDGADHGDHDLDHYRRFPLHRASRGNRPLSPSGSTPILGVRALSLGGSPDAFPVSAPSAEADPWPAVGTSAR